MRCTPGPGTRSRTTCGRQDRTPVAGGSRSTERRGAASAPEIPRPPGKEGGHHSRRGNGPPRVEPRRGPPTGPLGRPSTSRVRTPHTFGRPVEKSNKMYRRSWHGARPRRSRSPQSRGFDARGRNALQGRATSNGKSGVPDRIRTDDIQLGKLTLYQLSYGHSVSAAWRKVGLAPGGVKLGGALWQAAGAWGGSDRRQVANVYPAPSVGWGWGQVERAFRSSIVEIRPTYLPVSWTRTRWMRCFTIVAAISLRPAETSTP